MSEFAPEQIEAYMRKFKAKLLHTALNHLSNLDHRTGIVLDTTGVFQRTTEQSMPIELVEIILEKGHPKRMDSPIGPFIFYRKESGDSNCFALDMTDVLLNDSAAVRAAAYEHIQQISSSASQHLTPSTTKLLLDLKDSLCGESSDLWRVAAITLFDALKADLRFQLLAIRQSLRLQFEDGLREYLPQIARPSLRALEAVQLPVVKPSQQQKEALNLIQEYATSSASLGTFCEEYFRVLGFVPLQGVLSFNAAVEMWRSLHASPTNLWDEIWGWADNSLSPLPAFHAASFFLSNLEAVPESKVAKLRETILLISIAQLSVADEKLSTPWRLRKELAAHFLKHLESIAPQALGEPLAIMAWWLSDQLASILSESPRGVEAIRNALVIPESRSSDHIWRLLNPSIERVGLSLMTLTEASPWTLGLLVQLDKSRLQKLGFRTDKDAVNNIGLAIGFCVLRGFPTQPKDVASVTYLFEQTLDHFLGNWASYLEGHEARELALSLHAWYLKQANLDEIGEDLKSLVSANEADVNIVVCWAYSLALQGLLPQKAIRECLSDDKWRLAVFSRISAHQLEILFLALSVSLEKSDHKWMAELPFLYAATCEAVDSMERRRTLVGLTAVCGIHTYSFAAVRRILSSEKVGAEASEFVKGLPAWLLGSGHRSTWLTGRVRALAGDLAVI